MKILLLYFAFFSSFSLWASYEDILNMAQKYNQKKKDMISFEKEKRDLMGKIYELEKETSKLVRDKGKFDDNRLEIDEDIKKVSRHIVDLEDELRILTKRVMSRWNQVQKIQNLPWMYVFLSSYSPSELERTLKSLDSINENEASMIKSYMNKVEDLHQEKKKLQSLAKELIFAKKGFTEKEKRIKEQHKKRKKLLEELNSKINFAKKSLKKVKKLGKRLADIHQMNGLKLLFGSSFFEKKGNLPHPIDARLLHGYGLNQKLIKDNVKLLHKGYFYKSKKPKAVKSINLGRVKYVKKRESYGYTVVVDHGSNYYSVYSYLKKVRVEKGDLVEEGHPLGFTGNYHSQFGAGLYFEIRHFSEPEDPKKWLRKRIKKDKLAGISSEEGAV